MLGEKSKAVRAAARIGVFAALLSATAWSGVPAIAAPTIRSVAVDAASERTLTAGPTETLDVVFSDGGSLILGPGAVVVIEAYAYDAAACAGAMDLRVVQGRVRISGGRLNDCAAVEIETPDAEMRLEAGSALIAVEDGGSRAYLLNGRALAVSTETDGEVLYRPEFGVAVRGGAVDAPARVASTTALTDLRSLSSGGAAGVKPAAAPSAEDDQVAAAETPDGPVSGGARAGAAPAARPPSKTPAAPTPRTPAKAEATEAPAAKSDAAVAEVDKPADEEELLLADAVDISDIAETAPVATPVSGARPGGLTLSLGFTSQAVESDVIAADATTISDGAAVAIAQGAINDPSFDSFDLRALGPTTNTVIVSSGFTTVLTEDGLGSLTAPDADDAGLAYTLPIPTPIESFGIDRADNSGSLFGFFFVSLSDAPFDPSDTRFDEPEFQESSLTRSSGSAFGQFPNFSNVVYGDVSGLTYQGEPVGAFFDVMNYGTFTGDPAADFPLEVAREPDNFLYVEGRIAQRLVIAAREVPLGTFPGTDEISTRLPNAEGIVDLTDLLSANGVIYVDDFDPTQAYAFDEGVRYLADDDGGLFASNGAFYRVVDTIDAANPGDPIWAVVDLEQIDGEIVAVDRETGAVYRDFEPQEIRDLRAETEGRFDTIFSLEGRGGPLFTALAEFAPGTEANEERLVFAAGDLDGRSGVDLGGGVIDDSNVVDATQVVVDRFRLSAGVSSDFPGGAITGADVSFDASSNERAFARGATWTELPQETRAIDLTTADLTDSGLFVVNPAGDRLAEGYRAPFLHVDFGLTARDATGAPTDPTGETVDLRASTISATIGTIAFRPDVTDSEFTPSVDALARGRTIGSSRAAEYGDLSEAQAASTLIDGAVESTAAGGGNPAIDDQAAFGGAGRLGFMVFENAGVVYDQVGVIDPGSGDETFTSIVRTLDGGLERPLGDAGGDPEREDKAFGLLRLAVGKGVSAASDSAAASADVAAGGVRGYAAAFVEREVRASGPQPVDLREFDAFIFGDTNLAVSDVDTASGTLAVTLVQSNVDGSGTRTVTLGDPAGVSAVDDGASVVFERTIDVDGAPASVTSFAARSTTDPAETSAVALVSGDLVSEGLPETPAAYEHVQWGFFFGDLVTAEGAREHVHLGSFVAGDVAVSESELNFDGEATYQGHMIGDVSTENRVYTAQGTFTERFRFNGDGGGAGSTSVDFDGRSFSGQSQLVADDRPGVADVHRYVSVLSPSADGVSGAMIGSFVGGGDQTTAPGGVIGSFRLQNTASGADGYVATGTFGGDKTAETSSD